jgi:hypothetical protein
MPPPAATWGPPPLQDAHPPKWARSGIVAGRVGTGRAVAIAAILGGLLTASGLLVWLALWYHPPRPVGAVLVGAGYETNLTVPHNVYGWRTVERLAAPGGGPLKPAGEPLRLKAGDRWDRDLDAAAGPAVLVYLALHGGTDAKGPYLLCDDAALPTAEDSLLRMSDVIARLARLPADRDKVLVLDATQPEADEERGELRNDFARALAGLDAAILAVPNLVVVSASGPDQRSWPCPEVGETAFGFYLRRALEGEADDVNGDGWLQLNEALDATARAVTAWAAANRDSRQTPVVLPAGPEGWRRAGRVTLGRHHRPPPAATPPPAPLPADLRTAWQTARDLAGQVPAPFVYQPALWSRYLDTLLRFEQLLDAGADDGAARVRDDLRSQEAVLRRGSGLDLDSIQNALPLPTAAGWSTEDYRTVTEALWEANPADAAKLWQARLATVANDPQAIARLRLGIMREIMERGSQAAEFHVDRAQVVFRLIQDPSRPRPVEAQTVAIFKRDLPDAPHPATTLRLGLRVRLLAERAALGIGPGSGCPYSDRVLPFARATLDRADAERLSAQDLLLATDPASLADARSRLDVATNQYTEALDRSGAAARALAVRDRGFADLSYYGRWHAHSGDPHGKSAADRVGHERLEAVGRLIEDLWAEVHDLDANIRAAAVSDKAGDAAAALAVRAENSQVRLDRLAAEFTARCAELTGVDLPSVWRESEAALFVPLLDPDLRARLLENKRRTSWRFFTQTKAADAAPPPPEIEAERSADRARRGGRVAQARIGRAFFSSLDPGGEPYDAVAHRLTTFAADPDGGWTSLALAGREIGRRLAALPTATDARCEQAARLADDAPLEVLAEADALSRLAAGTTTFRADAPTLCRRAWFGRLLTRQADRTWNEHWYAVDPADEPYYRRAGRLYLADAATGGDPKAIAASAARLAEPGGLAISGNGLVVTSEPTVTAAAVLGLAHDAVVPLGRAVWQAAPGPGLSAAEPVGSRRVALVGAADAPLDLALRNTLLGPAEEQPPLRPVPTASTVRLTALFRGQRIVADLPATIYPRPVVTVNQFPTPRLASVAVRAGPDLLDRIGTAVGSVAFVLDCSGSMGAADGQPLADSKFAHATTALENVLRQLPPGTAVSLWVFGQAVGPGRTEPDAERTVTQILAPTRWDPAQLPGVMARVRYPALIPWNESPVLRAMSEAKRDFTGASGFHTMVVLTDGADNRAATDRVLNPQGRSVPDLLREMFRGTGIAVHVVGFRLPASEEEVVRKQFEVVSGFDPPGSFTTAADLNTLSAALRRALRPTVRYWLETEANILVPGAPAAGLAVGTAGGGDRWFAPGLAAGGYKLRVQAESYFMRELYVAPADRLLLDLSTDWDGRLALSRVGYAATDHPTRPHVDKQDWRLSLLQDQRRGVGLRSLATLERNFDPAERTLQVVRPKGVWYDLSPAGVDAAATAVTWNAEFGYPAPAWALASPEWPAGMGTGAPARPTVRAWWNPDQEAEIAGRFDRGVDFQSVSELTGRSLFVDGDEVHIESVTAEEHVVDVSEGQRARQKCLVVRVIHGVDNPVRIGVRGVPFVGQSLWQYPAVGRTTAVFWPVPAAAVGADLTAVELISLRAFRREAEQRGFFATLSDLPPPDPADEAPRPPLPLP